MMNLLTAALVAAAPAPAAGTQPADAHAQHAQMGHGQMQHSQGQPGKMGEMKDCCCKDKMAKMHGSPAGQPPQPKQ